jgi:hypothetical protein
VEKYGNHVTLEISFKVTYTSTFNRTEAQIIYSKFHMAFRLMIRPYVYC